MKKILVTWWLWFIWSYFIKLALQKGYYIINIDKKTYASRKDLGFEKNPNYELVEEDICSIKKISDWLDYVVHFAAESHVDNSIETPKKFLDSNIYGVYNMLELIKNSDNNPEFIYISTDEVYWEIISGSFSENSEIKASNVYAATKVAAEQLVFAYWKTNWLKYKICRSTNNYWYWQDAEKLLAKTIKYSLEWKKMTIHWDWKYFREWIYVWDNVAWIFTVLEKWSVGEVYNIWSGVEYDNLTMVKKVLKEIWLAEDFYENVKNRKWQDIRYSLDSSKIRKLWWEPKMLVDDYISIYIDKTKNKDEGRFL